MDPFFPLPRILRLLQRLVRHLRFRFPRLLHPWASLPLLTAVAVFAGQEQCRALPLAYVGTRFDGLSVFDTTSDSVIAHLPGVPGVTLPMAVDEVGVAVSPEGDRVFLTNPLQGLGTVFALDTGSNTVVNTIRIPDPPRDATTLAGIAVSPNGKLLYVVDRGCIYKNAGACGVNAPEGKLRIIEADTGVVRASPKAFSNFDAKEIVIDPRGRWVFAAPTFMPAGVAPFIVAYDRYTGRTQNPQVGGSPGVDDVSLAVHPTGQWLYVSQHKERRVTVLDVSVIDRGFSDPVVARISVGSAPRGMAVHPAGTMLYVVDQGVGRVWVIDTARNEVVGSAPMAVNGLPHSAAVDPVHDRLYVLSGGSFSLNATGFLAPRVSGISVYAPATFGQFIAPDSYCGNGRIEGSEQCDDGGICVDGADAGQPCHLSFDCEGDGRCVAAGGDGCAGNCTEETVVDLPLVSGIVANRDLGTGTSGLVLTGAEASPLVLPISGTLRLQIGAERYHEIPVVVRADPDVPGMPLQGACACLGRIVHKTCGGIRVQHDQLTPALDCTADESICEGGAPCAPVYGDGNLGAGVARCDALSGVDVSLAADLGAPSSVRTAVAGAGGPGSARIPAALTLTVHPGACTGAGPGYGADGIRCTADDGIDPAAETMALPMMLSTGTANGTVVPASGLGLDPIVAVGATFDCEALRAGDARGVGLVGASFTSSGAPAGEAVVSASLFAAPLPTHTPTPTATTVVTPSRTPRATNTKTWSPTVPPTRTASPSATPVLTATRTPTITPIGTPPRDAIDASGHWVLTVGGMACAVDVTQGVQALVITGACPQFNFELRGWIDVVTGYFQASGSATGCSPLTADGTVAPSGNTLVGAIVCPSFSGAMTGSRQASATPTTTATSTVVVPTSTPTAPSPPTVPPTATAPPTATTSATATVTAALPSTPVVAIAGDMGRPGDSVQITLTLSEDSANQAVALDVEIVFDAAVLRPLLPVRDHCALDARMATTHGIGGQLLAANVLLVSIFPKGVPSVLPPLGNGPLVSCPFMIESAAGGGATTLTLQNVALTDVRAGALAATTSNGAVVVIGPSPTATNVEQSPSPTPTTVEPSPSPTRAPTTHSATQIPISPTVKPTCPGDCDGDGHVTVGELIEGVRMSLGALDVEHCSALNRNGDGQITVGELIAAVQAALGGCGS